MNRKILALFICFVFAACSAKKSDTGNTNETAPPKDIKAENHPDKNFSLIEDFEKNVQTFRSDTFKINNYSNDEGELTVYHNKEKAYLVLDVWLVGETKKIHTTYWTDKELNFKIVKQTTFLYDRPNNEDDYKVTEKTEFYSYTNNSFIRYHSGKQEIKSPDNKEIEMNVRGIFENATKDLKIIK